MHDLFKKKGIKSAIRLVNEKMLRLAVYGSPDECISKLERLEKAGVNQILLGAPLGPNPKESINIIGKQIIPHFRKK